MKSILISKPPKQMANILSGKQSVIIVKTAPRCSLPIDVYIYCTKTIKPISDYDWGEFTFDDLPKLGKVVAKFTLRKVDWFCTRDFWGEYEEGIISISGSSDPAIVRKSCVSQREIDEYTKGKPAYAWHISDLEIFDEPKELPIHVPQSWCYWEEKEEEK